MIKVLIVHSTRLMCSVLSTVMHDEPDIKVIGCATEIETALNQAESSDIALIDTNLPNKGALHLTRAIAKAKYDTRVIITGVEKQPDKILTYVEAGASGYVLQEVDVEDLLDNVRAVHEDEHIATPDIVGQLIKRVAQLADLCTDQDRILSEIEQLTPRENDVIELITNGLTNKEIAEELTIEVGTVKNHVHSILQKLGVDNRREAAAFYNRYTTDDTN